MSEHAKTASDRRRDTAIRKTRSRVTQVVLRAKRQGCSEGEVARRALQSFASSTHGG